MIRSWVGCRQRIKCEPSRNGIEHAQAKPASICFLSFESRPRDGFWIDLVLMDATQLAQHRRGS